MCVHPAKTQISLEIRPVWLKSSLSAWRKLGSLSVQWRLWSDWADAQAGLSLCLAHSHFVGFVMSRLILCWMGHKTHNNHQSVLWASREFERYWATIWLLLGGGVLYSGLEVLLFIFCDAILSFTKRAIAFTPVLEIFPSNTGSWNYFLVKISISLIKVKWLLP